MNDPDPKLNNECGRERKNKRQSRQRREMREQVKETEIRVLEFPEFQMDQQMKSNRSKLQIGNEYESGFMCVCERVCGWVCRENNAGTEKIEKDK